MQHKNWNCPKCHNTSFETDQFRGTRAVRVPLQKLISYLYDRAAL